MKNRYGIEVIEKYGSNCWYCGVKLKWKNLTIDHFIPQNKGGSNDIDNLRPSCKKCNSQKLDRDIEIFRLIKQRNEGDFPVFISSTVIVWMKENYDFDFNLPEYKFFFERVGI